MAKKPGPADAISATKLAARIVEDDEELAGLETEWWELWRRSHSATPFQSPAWLLPWWASFRPGRLFTIAIRGGDRLVGLAPFYIEQGALGRRILPLGISVSDYLDVLLDPQWEGPAAQALIAEISRQSGRWNRWDLEELKPGAAGLALTPPPGCSEINEAQSACPVLPLRLGDGLAYVPSSKRRNLRTARNRGARRQAEIFVPPPERWREFMTDLFRLHGARWKLRGESGVLDAQTVRTFHEASVARLLRAGLLRFYGMRLDGQLVGAYHGLLDRGTAYYYLAGFDPAFAFESPGMGLVGHAIEEAAREGASEFHFLRGQEAYKYEWGASDRWNRRRMFQQLRAS